MSDQTSLVELSASEMVRQAQVMKVLALKLEGDTTPEACRKVGITVRTFYRWLSKSRNVQIVQQLAGEAMIAGAIEAINAFPEVVAMYAQAIADSDTHLRDKTVAGKEIRSIVEAFAKPFQAAPTSRAGDEGEDERPALAQFNPQGIINLEGGGQVSMEVRVKQPQVIENPPQETATSPASERDTSDPQS